MKKTLATRIAGLAVIYCVVFYILVLLQFSNNGSFSLAAGAMNVRGRYSQTEQKTANEVLYSLYEDSSILEVTDGIKIYYGGLEFKLSEDRGKGLTLTDNNGDISVNPEYFILTETIARFVLPGGTTLVFNSLNSPRGPELRISAEFSEDILEVIIPIIPRRSSLIRENGQVGIMYGGSRYLFSRPTGEIENRNITLTKENSFISYRSRGKQRTFDPADYIIAKSHNYDSEITNWIDASFSRWNQNAASLQNEDDIIAYCSQAASRGSLTAAIATIPRDFINSPAHTYLSAGFTGGMSNAYRLFTENESEKSNLIMRLARERSLDILKEEHLLDHLFERNNTPLVNEVIDIIKNTEANSIIIDHCPGLLEIYSDLKRWRPLLDNPIGHLTEQILLLVSDSLLHDAEEDHVFVLNFEGMNLDFSLRLGNALVPWAQAAKNTEWEAIGKSLVLSALESSADKAGKFHNTLKSTEYYPRAALLTDNGQWAWTVSPSVRMSSTTEGNINITFSYPVNTIHYVIICGIRPFIRLQLYGADWRSEPQFERSDSSGWIYYPQNQILILKLRHRTAVENVRLVYWEPPPPPVIEITEDEEAW
jgi:hypothetical protein